MTILGRKPWLALFLAGLLVACDDGPTDPGPGPDPDPDPDPDPIERVFHSASAAGVSTNTISAEVTVIARGYDEARVRAWREGEAAEFTPSVAFLADTVLNLAVLGLHSEADYSFEVLLRADASEEPVDTLSFTTGGLPDWLPTAVPVGDDPAPGFLVLSVPDGPVFLDNTGRVVWYLFAPDPVLSNFQAHDGGFYTLLGPGTKDPDYLLLDELGRETGRAGCVGRDTRFHAMRMRPTGDYYVLCDDRITTDLTALGGLPEVRLTWTVVQHVSRQGNLLWEWRSSDHFNVADVGQDLITDAETINVTHGNGIAFDTDGNLLVSFRSLNEITKIDAVTGDVIWRFGGGLGNEFTFVADPKSSFERNHGIRVVGPNVIQLHDNGDEAPSRLVRYRINEAAMTAELLWEFIDSPTTYTAVGGSTDVLEDGGALVSFGRAGRVVETDEAGQRKWELTGIDGMYVFRAQRIPSLYASERM